MTPLDTPLASTGEPEEWWFNVKTSQVEFGRLTASANRIGPFATRQLAEQALQIIAERAAAIRSEEDED
jgi:hypothetical protein